MKLEIADLHFHSLTQYLKFTENVLSMIIVHMRTPLNCTEHGRVKYMISDRREF